jgi:aminobenzoyl-glutamate utilization protein B
MDLRPPVLATIALALPTLLLAQDAKDIVTADVVAQAEAYEAMAMEIWDLSEMGYQEHKSSALLQERLADSGFTVTAGVAGIPTAFVASYGSGEPVIGILAEFDALPGLGQDHVPERSPIDGKPAGHACGHNLFGVGSTAAALAVRSWLESSGQTGTIRLYGTPAEEGGGGKIYMSRAGLFDDVDAMLNWHPSDANSASPGSSLANISAKFRFSGVSAHAARAPERGRSALDGVEAMNYMTNLLREHVPQETRIHYVITNGGLAPNVVPDFAEVYYYLRHPSAPVVRELFERLVATADGAALGTGTEVEYEVVNGVYNLLANTVLARVMNENLLEVGGVDYTADEQRFAELMYETLPSGMRPLSSASEVQPFSPVPPQGMASTDTGDVSWVVPTTGLATATYVPGVVSHTWQAAAVAGTTIGTKGMLVAAKTMARTAVDLILDPTLVAEAKGEFEERRAGERYVSFVGDNAPPLDYRGGGD